MRGAFPNLGGNGGGGRKEGGKMDSLTAEIMLLNLGTRWGVYRIPAGELSDSLQPNGRLDAARGEKMESALNGDEAAVRVGELAGAESSVLAVDVEATGGPPRLGRLTAPVIRVSREYVYFAYPRGWTPDFAETVADAAAKQFPEDALERENFEDRVWEGIAMDAAEIQGRGAHYGY